MKRCGYRLSLRQLAIERLLAFGVRRQRSPAISLKQSKRVWKSSGGTSSRRLNVKSVSHRQRGLLIRLSRDFLNKHDVACDEAPRWDKTPAQYWLPGFVYLMHIRHPTVVDAIAPPAVTTDNVEIFRRVELRSLHWREPFSQEGYPTGLSGVHHRPVALAQT